jgi:two-component system nitrate/nitrite response regulator NarL
MTTHAPSPTPAPVKPVSVLIIDDHPVLVSFLTQLLEREAKYKLVGRAETAREGIELCRTLKPHLVILDISLLDSNDLSCLRTLHAECPRSRVLVFTGRITNVSDMLLAGAGGIMGKTAKLQDLLEAVDRVAQGGMYLCPQACEAVRRQVVAAPPIEKRNGPELSRRERDVLQHIAMGLSSRQIAAKMQLSQNTIAAFRSRLMKKTELHSTAKLVLYAARLGLVRVPGLRKSTSNPMM